MSATPQYATDKYVASYDHAGCSWVLEFCAADMDDAQRKVASIRRSLTLDGRVAVKISIPTNWIGRLLSRVRRC